MAIPLHTDHRSAFNHSHKWWNISVRIEISLDQTLAHTFLMVTHSHSVHLLPWRGWQPINPTMMAAVVMEGLGRLLSVSRSHPARTLFLYHHWLREGKRETSINVLNCLWLSRVVTNEEENKGLQRVELLLRLFG